MGNRISEDALSIIACFDIHTPKRFLEVWNILMPGFARKIWRHPHIRKWNRDVPFPNMYAFFSNRFGCLHCGHLLYCPIPNVCPACDQNGGAFEKKTHLKLRYGLQPYEFQSLTEMPVHMQRFSRGQYFSIDEAFFRAFQRRNCDWRTWYQDLRRQALINAKAQKTREERRKKTDALLDYVRRCAKAHENLIWHCVKSFYRKNSATMQDFFHQIVSIVAALGLSLETVMRHLPGFPLDEAMLYRILYGCCKRRFLHEYCPYQAAQQVLGIPKEDYRVDSMALKASALGFIPYDYPWRRNISPMEWQNRELMLQNDWTIEQKTDFMMGQSLMMGWDP